MLSNICRLLRNVLIIHKNQTTSRVYPGVDKGEHLTLLPYKSFSAD